MGAEDFSYVLAEGAGRARVPRRLPAAADPATAPPNHSNRVVFDEAAMATGSRCTPGWRCAPCAA